jgi:uncharacterized membrane-anchored protein
MVGWRVHDLREVLHNELHARPSVVVTAPAQVRSWAFLIEPDEHEAARQHWQQLTQMGVGVERLEESNDRQAVARLGSVRIKWEHHSEFVSYTLYAEGALDTAAILGQLPAGWFAAAPGSLIAAVAVDIRPITTTPPDHFLSAIDPFGPTTVAAKIGDGAGWLITDLQLHDGMTRFTIIDAAIMPRQLGRIVQRLIEIETYRMLALLAFPAARQVSASLSVWEKRLAQLMHELGSAEGIEAERQLLQSLTQLAGEVERSVADSNFRFGAAAAYYRLVQQRADDLREQRLTGFSTLKGFLERRLAPAMNTCAAVHRRQEELSARISRNSQLLRTRVDLKLQEQNQQLLDEMNRRARLQLRLQEAAEQFSVVAITYYGSQLVQYLAKAGKEWLPLAPEVVTALAIPAIAALAALGIYRLRRKLHVTLP